MKKREFFKIEGDKINRIRKHCPKCGPGVFLAEHKNRFSCGKCGYTEFKGGVKPPIEKETPVEAKPETPIGTSETKPTVEQPTVETPSEPEPVKDTPTTDTAPTEEPIDKESHEEKSNIEESTSETQSEGSEEKIEKKPKEESTE